MFISLSLGRKRNEPKRKAAGYIPEAKKWQKIPKTGKRASLERARFFTEFFTIFLHASETRPELDSNNYIKRKKTNELVRKLNI
jgi:hypothetical protein